MAIRMTGLVSNMDTESVVEAMMEAHRVKLTKIENKKTKLEWKQEKWKELNTKLYKLYTEQTSKMHLISNYKINKATSADESIVKVTSDKNATTGTHSIAVEQLASSQYVTGAKLASGTKGTTKLATIDPSLVGTRITIKSAKGEKTLDITDKTSLNDFASACSSVGLNASFDEKQGRFFISSADSGVDQAFSITSSSYSGSNASMLTAKNSIISLAGSSNSTSVYNALNSIESKMNQLGTEQNKKDFVNGVLDGSITEESIKNDSNLTAEDKSLRISILNNVNTIKNSVITQSDATLKSAITTTKTNDLNALLVDKIKNSDDGYFETTYTVDGEEKTFRVEIPKSSDLTVETDEDIQKMAEEAIKKSSAMQEYIKYQVQDEFENQKDAKRDEALNGPNGLKTNMEAYVSGTGATESNGLDALGLGNIKYETLADGKIDAKSDYAGCTVTDPSDCIVEYNGAKLTGSTNTISVNGLTFEAISVSEKVGDQFKATSVSVTKDSQGMYDMIKDFLKEYNSILEEMNTLYSAKSARGYEPLTDEEKQAMTDEQVELWENKIKDSLLRRDSTVGGITSAMRSAMSSVVVVDGKKYSLSSFGIMTSKDYTEGGLLHIYGDKEDSTYSDKDDKLLKAINEDPELVAKVMAGIADNLHNTLIDKMSKTSLSSALTFYNDKQIDKQLTSYKKEISTMEKKLKEKENAYYKQFTAMEKAMASLQSQQSSLAGLLGSN